MEKERIFAAALKYDEDEDNAPKVLAKGEGETAKMILQKAKEFKIPIVKDEEAALLLKYVNLGEEIPPQLYEAVAKILAFVLNIDKKA